MQVQTCSFRIMENLAYGWTGFLQAGSTQEGGGRGTFYLKRQNKLNRASTLLFSINRSLWPEWDIHIQHWGLRSTYTGWECELGNPGG